MHTVLPQNEKYLRDVFGSNARRRGVRPRRRSAGGLRPPRVRQSPWP